MGAPQSTPPTATTSRSYSLGEVEVEEVVLPLGPAPEDADAGPEAEGDEAEEEAEVPRKAREPSEPTDEERKRHETTHLPFRTGAPTA